jgi:hypothetical protein
VSFNLTVKAADTWLDRLLSLASICCEALLLFDHVLPVHACWEGSQPAVLTGWADQQATLGDLCAQCCVLVRVLQEVNNLLQLKLGTITTLRQAAQGEKTAGNRRVR